MHANKQQLLGIGKPACGPSTSGPLASHTNDGELLELIAPFYRYDINMRQFSAFITDAHQEGFTTSVNIGFGTCSSIP